MIFICHDDYSSTLIAKIHGVFTQDDFEHTFLPKLNQLIEQHNKINLLFEFDDDFMGWELAALWREIKFSIEYFNSINKIALIGNSNLLKWSFKFLHPFSQVFIDRFTHGQIEKAQAWLAIN